MSKAIYDFFVDGKKYESTQQTVTGAQLRAMVTGLDPTFELWEEGHGQDPDRKIGDTDSIDLERQQGGPRRFFTVPPATFGYDEPS